MIAEPLKIALFDAHFMPYWALAILVIAVRLLSRRFRSREGLLLLLFGSLMALEFVQLFATHHTFCGTSGYGYPRYFGVLSPFLWIFAASALAALWGRRGGWLRGSLRAVLLLVLVCGLFFFNFIQIGRSRIAGTAYDTAVAVARILPVIKADYKGPPRQKTYVRAWHEYYTGRRPLIACPYGAAGWEIRGDSCGATSEKREICPYPEDYLFFPLNSGYLGITNLDERVYTCVTKVPGGEGTIWGLFRRR